MKHFRKVNFVLLVFVNLVLLPQLALAQPYYNGSGTTSKKPRINHNEPSTTSVKHAERVSDTCPGSWESQKCLKAISESTLVLAANYAASLEKKGHQASLEQIKEHCAAATAASRGEFPAYAMRSAFTECANIIADISSETGIDPDKSHYQLLAGAVMCLDGDFLCTFIEQGLRKY